MTSICLILILIFLLICLLFMRHKESRCWKMWSGFITDLKSNGEALILFLLTIIRPSKFRIILLFLIVLFFGFAGARWSGRTYAENLEEFYVMAQSPEVVVLRIYSDHLITTPFDRLTKQVERKFYILKLSEIPTTPLSLEKIGPLKIKESPKAIPDEENC
jgi:hypothetical protein